MKKKTTERFIQQSKDKFKDKFNYDKTIHTGRRNQVIITCKKHGDFKLRPYTHLRNNNGGGCKGCRIYYGKGKTTSILIEQSKNHYGDKFNYDKTIYTGSYNKIIITCKEHGDFKQMACAHIRGSGGCPDCRLKSLSISHTKSTEQFIKDAQKIHGNTYDYSEVKYTSVFKNITIICKIHGKFQQQPRTHLQQSGCQICAQSRSEKICREIFEELMSYKFPTKRPKILQGLEFDGYCEKINLAFEYNGIQHYKRLKHFFHNNAEKRFDSQVKRDRKKRKLCKEHKITLITIPYIYNYRKTDEMRYYIAQQLMKHKYLYILDTTTNAFLKL